jgi:hypothetical protein
VSDTVVLYHMDCADGFGAAYAAWTVLKDGARYIPVQYGRPMPAIPDGSTVYILDFSYPRADLEALAARCPDIRVLDHHRTAKEALAGLPFATFDMEKSGAVLAWEFFHPGEMTPRILEYVQDRDLWRWRLPRSREFSASLSVEPRDFRAWDRLEYSLRSDVSREFFFYRGEAILAYQDTLVSGLCGKATLRDVGGHRVPVVNSPLFQSEIGEELCRRNPDAPFAASFFVRDDGQAVVSLRSRDGFDVAAIAKARGGGGHAAAAGYECSVAELVGGPTP